MSNKPPKNDDPDIDPIQVKIYEEIQRQNQLKKQREEQQKAKQAHMQRLQKSQQITKGGPDINNVDLTEDEDLDHDDIDPDQVKIMEQIKKENEAKQQKKKSGIKRDFV